MNSTIRTAKYVGPYHANYHQFKDETGETHFLNHAPRDIQVGDEVSLVYRTTRNSGLWYAESLVRVDTSKLDALLAKR
jgi:hypothetical protein